MKRFWILVLLSLISAMSASYAQSADRVIPKDFETIKTTIIAFKQTKEDCNFRFLLGLNSRLIELESEKKSPVLESINCRELILQQRRNCRRNKLIN